MIRSREAPGVCRPPRPHRHFPACRSPPAPSCRPLPGPCEGRRPGSSTPAARGSAGPPRHSPHVLGAPRRALCTTCGVSQPSRPHVGGRESPPGGPLPPRGGGWQRRRRPVRFGIEGRAFRERYCSYIWEVSPCLPPSLAAGRGHPLLPCCAPSPVPQGGKRGAGRTRAPAGPGGAAPAVLLMAAGRRGPASLPPCAHCSLLSPPRSGLWTSTGTTLLRR